MHDLVGIELGHVELLYHFLEPALLVAISVFPPIFMGILIRLSSID
jgi:hypothetical protein